MDLGLKDKLVLITGSGSGIGKATASAYLEEGARVIVHGLTEAEVAACIEDVSPKGDVTGKAGDLTNLADANALCDFAQAQGDVDVLVNNVGIFSVKPFEELTDDDWMRYFEINVTSAVRMSRVFLPEMIRRGEGSIINMASEAGVKPLPQMVHYSVTKTAMLGLTRGMAELTKGTRVRVNTVEEERPFEYWRRGLFHFCIQDENVEERIKIIESLGGRQRMVHVRKYYPGEKPYRMVYMEDPFGNIFELYSHSYELTYSAGAYV